MKNKTTKLATLTKKDVDLKVAKYRVKLEAQIQEAKVLLQRKDIGAAIEKVYAQYGDVAISIGVVVALVCRDLGAMPESYRELGEEVATYIRNADWLDIRAGKNGGVRSLRVGVPIGKFGATCMSRILPAQTHSRKKKS